MLVLSVGSRTSVPPPRLSLGSLSSSRCVAMSDPEELPRAYSHHGLEVGRDLVAARREGRTVSLSRRKHRRSAFRAVVTEAGYSNLDCCCGKLRKCSVELNSQTYGTFATSAAMKLCPKGVTRWGQVFRSDSLHYLLPDELEIFDELGVRTIFDLGPVNELRGCSLPSGDDVVPLAVKPMAGDRHRSELGVGDLDPGRVVALVELGPNLQPGARRRGRDQVDDHLVAHEGTTLPVHRDRREEPVFDFVPLARARREVAHGDRQTGSFRELPELSLPEPTAVAVRAAGIGGDEEARRLRVGERADVVPPPPDRGDGEGRGVTVVADDDEALVREEVVDPVGDGLSDLGVGEVVHVDAHRTTLWLPGLPGVLQ